MEIRCLSLVKAKLISHDKVFKMKFEDFERLEKFNLLTKEIEKVQIKNNQNNTSSTGPKQKGGLTIKRDGNYERS